MLLRPRGCAPSTSSNQGPALPQLQHDRWFSTIHKAHSLWPDEPSRSPLATPFRTKAKSKGHDVNPNPWSWRLGCVATKSGATDHPVHLSHQHRRRYPNGNTEGGHAATAPLVLHHCETHHTTSPNTLASRRFLRNYIFGLTLAVLRIAERPIMVRSRIGSRKCHLLHAGNQFGDDELSRPKTMKWQQPALGDAHARLGRNAYFRG